MVKTEAVVVSCSLQPYRKGERYKAIMSDGSHRWLQRVTNILKNLAKPGLDRWYAIQAAEHYEWCLKSGIQPNFWDAVRAGERARDNAAKNGTRLHKAIEDYLSNGVIWNEFEFSPVQAYALRSWRVWWEESGLVASHVEKTLYSLTGGYGGTLDLASKDGDGWVIRDYKSGEFKPEHLWQLAAYALAMWEMGMGPVYRAELIHLPKEIGKPLKVQVAWDRDRLERRQILMGGWNAFLCACNSLPELEDSFEQEPLPNIYTPEYWGQEPISDSEIEELFS